MLPKVWFTHHIVTGSSSGFGLAVTEHILNNGVIAVATLRKPSALASLSTSYSADRLIVLPLDVTDKPSIAAAFAKAIAVFGRIDVVFNNAGYVMCSEAEGAAEDAARAQLDVNFWGAVSVSSEAVRVFREENSPPSGLLLQNSAMAVYNGLPLFGFYAASKSALEAFSWSLLTELDPAWNIKISLVQPGGFHTSVSGNAVAAPPHPAYTKPESATVAMRTWFESNHVLPGDVRKAAEVIYKLATLPEPPLRFPLGEGAVSAAGVSCGRIAPGVRVFSHPTAPTSNRERRAIVHTFGAALGFTSEVRAEVEKYKSWSEGTKSSQVNAVATKLPN